MTRFRASPHRPEAASARDSGSIERHSLHESHPILGMTLTRLRFTFVEGSVGYFVKAVGNVPGSELIGSRSSSPRSTAPVCRTDLTEP